MIPNLTNQDKIFFEIARELRQMLGSDLCEVWRKQKGQLRIVAWDGDKELDEEYLDRMGLDINTHPVIDKFLRNKQPMFIPDLQAPGVERVYYHQDEARARGWTSLLTAPLIHRQRVIGMINSYTYNKIEFQDAKHERSTTSMLLAYADRAADSIRNAELSSQLQVLHEMNQTLAGTFEEKEVIRQILHKGLELVGADMGCLYLVDINTGKLVLKDSLRIPEELIELKRKLGEGIAGWVAREGVELNVPDVSREPRHRALPGIEVKSEMAVPLRRKGQTIGVLTAKSRLLNAFTEDDVKLLASLAAQAAVAIGRANLIRHLQEVSHLAVTANYRKVANYIVEAVRDLTGAEVNLWAMSDQKEERGQYLRITASRGNFDKSYKRDAKTPIAPGSSITALALEQGQPIARKDILNDPEEPKFDNLEDARRHNWHSFMAVPLIGRDGERLGSLSLYSQSIDKFGSPDIELVQTFANQAAIALQQQKRSFALQQLAEVGEVLTKNIIDMRGSRLDEETQRQASEPEADIALDHVTQEMQERMNPLLEAIVEEATKILKGKGGELYLRVRGQDRVKLVAAKGIDPKILKPGDTLPFGEGMAGKVIQSKKPSIVKDYPTRSERIERVASPFTAVIGVPLLCGEEAIGVLTVFDDVQKRRFTNDDILILQRLAQQAAWAIHNAGLLERERRLRQQAETLRNKLEIQVAERTAELSKANAVLTALHETTLDLMNRLDLNDLLEAIIRRAGALVDASDGFIYLVDPGETEKAEMKVGVGIWSGLKGHSVRRGEGLVGKIWETGEPLRVPDYRTWPYRVWDSRLDPVRAMVGVSLKSGLEFVGVIGLAYLEESRKFGSEEVNLLSQFAQLASIALDNARLYTKAQQELAERTRAEAELQKAKDDLEVRVAERTAELSKANAVLTALHETTLDLMNRLEIDDLLEAIIRRAGALVDASDGFIYLVDPGETEKAEMKVGVGIWSGLKGHFVRRGEGLVGKIWETGEPLRVPDYRTWPYRVLDTRLDPLRSLIGVPLKSGLEFVGVIGLAYLEEGWMFGSEEVNLLSQFAQLASIALDNARLYTKAQAASHAKSEFLANTSHELNTPLNSILGYTQILEKERDLTEKQMDYLNKIEKNVELLSTLITDILNLSKIEAGKLELHPIDFHLPDFLENIVDTFRIRAEEKGIFFSYQPFDFSQNKPLSNPPMGIRGDEKRLRQVLTNLLGNAIKFTEKGKVTFKVGYSSEAGSPKKKIRFQVEDTGVGIAPENLKKIFEPFYQIDRQSRQVEGTDLGLAISKKLAKMMGSELEVKSTPGKGSIFRLDLDLPEASSQVKASKRAEKRVIIGFKKVNQQGNETASKYGSFKATHPKILVVDDEQEHRSILVGLLSPIGFELAEATDGSDALNKVTEFKPDLILMDLLMPVLDGLEATRRIWQLPEGKDIVVIATSASKFYEDSLTAGCSDFIPKPIQEEDLFEKLRVYLGLEWIYRERGKDTERQGDDENIPLLPHPCIPALLVGPSPEEATVLYDLAMKGDIKAIQERASRLKQLDEKFGPFATELCRLAKSFQVKQIREFIKPYLEGK